MEQQRLEEQLEKLRKATPNSTVKNSVSVVADSKISNHVDMTEERVVCYAAKDSTTAASTSAERYLCRLEQEDFLFSMFPLTPRL